MKATSKNMLKLQQLSQEKNEVKAELSDLFWLQQDTLPQELINAWGGFERLEKEAQRVEAKALKEIEGEIEEQQEFDTQAVKRLKLWNKCFVLLLLVILADFGTGMLEKNLSKSSNLGNFTGCTNLTSFATSMC